MPAGDDPPAFTPVDPYALARSEAQAAQLKRSYSAASVVARDGAFVLRLDERDARTPARRPVALPSEAAAALVAAEWNRQGEIVRPGEMPAMRLVNSVIDGVALSMREVRAEIVRFAGSDLLCYRAEAPAALVDQQAAAWDPVLAWTLQRWAARFEVAQGIIHVAQPTQALQAIDRAVVASIGAGPAAPFRLGALHVMTTLTGSALLGLATLCGAVTVAEAWRIAHVDEDFQISRWGEDAEATLRRDHRWRDFAAAGALAVTVGAPR